MTGLGSAKRQSRARTGAGRTRGETRLSFDIRRLYIRLGILRINPAVFLLAASALMLGYFYMFSLAYLFAFLHELGHIAAAKKLGVRIISIEIQPFGVCGRLGSEFIKDPFSEILIALAGPAVNISVCLIILIAESALRGAADFIGVYRDYILSVNICLALINLLPALPLDGGSYDKIQPHDRRSAPSRRRFAACYVGIQFFYDTHLCFYARQPCKRTEKHLSYTA